MKKTNKIIAVILCLCMMASFTALFASAEDEPESLPIYFGDITATKFKPDDPETVLQMEIEIEADAEGEEEKAAVLAGIDTIDTSAEIIFRDLPLEYVYALNAIGSIPVWASEEEFFLKDAELTKVVEEKTTIAKAKPVSYENGVLTVDVYAKDGTAGAKMIGIDLVMPPDEIVWDYFITIIPKAVLANSATGAYSSSESWRNFGKPVNNLATREVKFTKLETSALLKASELVSKVVSGSGTAAFIARIALILPVVFLELPIIIVRANSVYKVYGVNLYKTAFELFVKAPNIIYWLIKNTNNF